MKENNARISALKAIPSTKWNGNTVHATLDACLTVLNIEAMGSGWYKPEAIKINGLEGIYMIQQNGTLFCDARIIKEDENKYRIEYLIGNGYDIFEENLTNLGTVLTNKNFEK